MKAHPLHFLRKRETHWILLSTESDGPLCEQLLRAFRLRCGTHYAAFNLGGAGAHRYGRCCVVFDLRYWAPFHTCYAGDSIRACFQVDKSPALSEEEILAGFAT